MSLNPLDYARQIIQIESQALATLAQRLDECRSIDDPEVSAQLAEIEKEFDDLCDHVRRRVTGLAMPLSLCVLRRKIRLPRVQVGR